MLSMALWMATIVAPLQMIAGDLHGLNTLKYQPAKIAAMEGHYETQRGAPLILFGLPDDDKAETKYRIEIPKLGSLILTHDMNGEVKGLKEWPKAERPPAEIIFWTFRIMVGIGMLMIAIGLYSLWLRYKNQLYNSSIFHRALMIVSPIGFVAVICGWITTEVGRQPYTVYGLLTTAQSVSPIDAPAVSASLFAFIVTYFVVFGAGVFYLFKQFNLTPGMTDKKELGVKQNGVWGVMMTFFNRRKFTQ